MIIDEETTTTPETEDNNEGGDLSISIGESVGTSEAIG